MDFLGPGSDLGFGGILLIAPQAQLDLGGFGSILLKAPQAQLGTPAPA